MWHELTAPYFDSPPADPVRLRYSAVLERLGDQDQAYAARKNAHVLGIGQGGRGAH